MNRMLLYTTLLLFSVLALSGPFLQAAELKPENAQAFDAYIRAYEAKMHEEVARGEFLSIDHQESSLRSRAYQQLRRGEVLVEQRSSSNRHLPNALLHHWIGTAFFPGASVDQMFTVLKDYEDYQTIYGPEVVTARVL